MNGAYGFQMPIVVKAAAPYNGVALVASLISYVVVEPNGNAVLIGSDNILTNVLNLGGRNAY